MKKIISELYGNFLGSLDNTKKGFSARKLSALLSMTMVIVAHIKWFRSNHWEYLAQVLFLDYSFILVCLGLAVWQNVKEKEQPKEE